MPEHSEAAAVTAAGQATNDAQTRMAQASQGALSFLFGAQKLMLEELAFASNEFVERAQTEMHLFSELVSKMAGAHSVKDIRTMAEECSKHQLEFIRRDCDRVLKHGERVIETASSLLKPLP